jgi:1-acyl-sn-glycerol-3-phosphate acyltransferase
VALKARVPIIPCYIAGSPYGESVASPLLMTARVRVRFGSPIDLSEHYGHEHENERIGAILLHAVREIACLAGQEQFEPQLAGRKWLPESS